MDTNKRIIIPVTDDLFRQVKVWSAQNDVSIAEAGRALFESLVSGNGFTANLVSEKSRKPITKKR